MSYENANFRFNLRLVGEMHTSFDLFSGLKGIVSIS